MGVVQQAEVASWCAQCCTRHDDTNSCPGQVRITGLERHGWRGVYKTAHGGEAYGTLIAPAGQRWCARIVTCPNILWCIPGQGRAMKFVADTPHEAEAQAIGYVKDHCRRLGYRPLEDLPASVRIDMHDPGTPSPRPSPACRKLHAMSIKWGIDAPTADAGTRDLSESGLFLITPDPPEPGVPVRLHLRLEALAMPLEGRVVWRRERAEPGRPAGMGVQLRRPPALYVQFVRQLGAAQQPATAF